MNENLKFAAMLTLMVFAFCAMLLSSLPTRADELKRVTTESIKQQLCITDALFHEARSEPPLGKLLVIRTILNRADDPHWKASTPCEVVYQYAQFSFTFLSKSELNQRKFNEIYEWIDLLKYVNLTEFVEDPKGFEGVNHYLVCDWRERTSWDDNMTFLGQVGAHCFYRGY